MEDDDSNLSVASDVESEPLDEGSEDSYGSDSDSFDAATSTELEPTADGAAAGAAASAPPPTSVRDRLKMAAAGVNAGASNESGGGESQKSGGGESNESGGGGSDDPGPFTRQLRPGMPAPASTQVNITSDEGSSSEAESDPWAESESASSFDGFDESTDTASLEPSKAADDSDADADESTDEASAGAPPPPPSPVPEESAVAPPAPPEEGSGVPPASATDHSGAAANEVEPPPPSPSTEPLPNPAPTPPTPASAAVAVAIAVASSTAAAAHGPLARELGIEPAELEALCACFRTYDADCTGTIGRDSLGALLADLGETYDADELRLALRAVGGVEPSPGGGDAGDGATIELSEFLRWWCGAETEAEAALAEVDAWTKTIPLGGEDAQADGGGAAILMTTRQLVSGSYHTAFEFQVQVVGCDSQEARERLGLGALDLTLSFEGSENLAVATDGDASGGDAVALAVGELRAVGLRPSVSSSSIVLGTCRQVDTLKPWTLATSLRWASQSHGDCGGTGSDALAGSSTSGDALKEKVKLVDDGTVAERQARASGSVPTPIEENEKENAAPGLRSWGM